MALIQVWPKPGLNVRREAPAPGFYTPAEIVEHTTYVSRRLEQQDLYDYDPTGVPYYPFIDEQSVVQGRVATELDTLRGRYDGATTLTTGRNSEGDGNGANFTWDETSAVARNGTTVFGLGATGRWIQTGTVGGGGGSSFTGPSIAFAASGTANTTGIADAAFFAIVPGSAGLTMRALTRPTSGANINTRQAFNNSVHDLIVPHEDTTGTTAADRFATDDGQPKIWPAKTWFTFAYDSTLSRYRVRAQDDALTTGEPWSSLIARAGRKAGEERRFTDYGTGSARWHVGTSPGAVAGMVGPTLSGGYWKRVFAGTLRVSWFGALADRVGTGASSTPGNANYRGTDCAAAVNACFAYAKLHGFKSVAVDDGRYRHELPIAIDADVDFFCECRDSATFHYDGAKDGGGAYLVADGTVDYDGTDAALFVNGSHLTPYPDAAARFDVKRFSMRNLVFEAPRSKGIVFGCTIHPSINLHQVTITDCAGLAIDCGDSTYFVTMTKCLIMLTRGVRLRSSCDQFTCREVAFWYNRDYDIQLASPTFVIDNCDFELNSADNDNIANVLIPSAAWATGYGTICESRFGDEVQAAMAPFDIYLKYGGTRDGGGVPILPASLPNPLGGVRLLNNRHFGPTTLGRRTSPIVMDVGVSGFEMAGALVNTNYLSPYHITSVDDAGVATGSSVGRNYVERIEDVSPEIRGLFTSYVDTNGNVHALAAQSMAAWQCVYDVFFETTSGYGIPGTRKVALLSASPVDLTRHMCGVTLTACGVDTFTYLGGHGALVRSTLNTTGLPLLTPVYYTSGGISLTAGSPERVVGWTMSTGTNAWVRIDLNQPTYYSTQPNAGTWVRGEVAFKSNPSVSNGRELIGWKRKTTGTGHVAGTDWDEVYSSTNAGGAYTPTFSASGGGALGNGTISGLYSVDGKSATVSITLIAGTTTNFGTGQLNFSLPAGVAPAAIVTVGAASILDSSAGTYVAGGVTAEVTSTYFVLIATNGAYVTGANPVTLADGDIIRMSATFAI